MIQHMPKPIEERDNLGRIVSGHWRLPKPYWNRNWLYDQYVNQRKSAMLIAVEQECVHQNIHYFLVKHNIPRRSTSEAGKGRQGLCGKMNGMYGIRGAFCPQWKGGITELRQSLYSSVLWKKIENTVRRENKGCLLCGDNKGCHLHHIIPIAENPFLIFEEWNIVLLCKSCHSWIHSKKNIGKVLLNETWTKEKHNLSRTRN